MSTLKKKLTVYISKSLKTPDKNLEPIRKALISQGFIVTEYKEGTVYQPSVRQSADVVLIVPYTPVEGSGKRRSFNTQVGKGQFSEAINSCRENQLSFVYTGLSTVENILVSFLEESEYTHPKSSFGDWKVNYGTLKSYIKGAYWMDFKDVVKEHYIKEHLKELPLTPEVCFQKNYKLLLLN